MPDQRPGGYSTVRLMRIKHPELEQKFLELTVQAHDQEVECANNPEMWWNDDPRIQRLAVDICKECPIQRLCFDWALEAGERDGVWGGTTAPERAQLRKKLQKLNRIARKGQEKK